MSLTQTATCFLTETKASTRSFTIRGVAKKDKQLFKTATNETGVPWFRQCGRKNIDDFFMIKTFENGLLPHIKMQSLITARNHHHQYDQDGELIKYNIAGAVTQRIAVYWVGYPAIQQADHLEMRWWESEIATRVQAFRRKFVVSAKSQCLVLY